jgi:hypothetical protein
LVLFWKIVVVKRNRRKVVFSLLLDVKNLLGKKSLGCGQDFCFLLQTKQSSPINMNVIRSKSLLLQAQKVNGAPEHSMFHGTIFATDQLKLNFQK